MKKLFIFLITLLFVGTFLYAQQIPSGSYEGRKEGMILQGEGKPIKNVSLELIRLKANKKSKRIKVKVSEYLVIAKAGVNTIVSNQVSAALTPGSIALLTEGDQFRISNTSNEDSWYYLMKYEKKDPAKGSDTARSLVRIWEETRFNAHDRGGVRPYFNKQTSQTTRFEMHVTTLRAGLSSHDPHTHDAEEIVLIIDGDTEMLIGDKMYKASTGDLYYLGSNVLHGIKNIGSKPSTYFAYQWN